MAGQGRDRQQVGWPPVGASVGEGLQSCPGVRGPKPACQLRDGQLTSPPTGSE